MRTKESVHKTCNTQKSYIIASVGYEKISSMYGIAVNEHRAVQQWIRSKPMCEAYNPIFKLQYDVVHLLCEALLRKQGYKSLNHTCLFAYICIKYKDLDWNFFERIRVMRNKCLYYGEPVSYDGWLRLNKKMQRHIVMLKEKF